MAKLRSWDLFRMALRASLLQTTWNYERQQGVGWAFALKPALERLIPDQRARCERLAEHTAYFNTQPTLASIALGAVAALEEQREAGEGLNADGIARAKSALGSSLAALGDRLFWLGLRPLAACFGAVFALSNLALGALVLWVCYNAVHQTVRFLGTGWGYRAGPAVMGPRLRRALEQLTRLTGLCGCVMVAVLIAALLVPEAGTRPLIFEVLMLAGIGVGFVVAQRPRPSTTDWALGATTLCVIASWLHHA
jgi:mannose/fructose/N-acetylgalactosamine-specific phosphotransferase system component IID